MTHKKLLPVLGNLIKKSIGLVLEDELVYTCEEGFLWIEIPQKKLWWMHDRYSYPHNYKRVFRNPLGFLIVGTHILRVHIPLKRVNKRAIHIMPKIERRRNPRDN